MKKLSCLLLAAVILAGMMVVPAWAVVMERKPEMDIMLQAAKKYMGSAINQYPYYVVFWRPSGLQSDAIFLFSKTSIIKKGDAVYGIEVLYDGKGGIQAITNKGILNYMQVSTYYNSVYKYYYVSLVISQLGSWGTQYIVPGYSTATLNDASALTPDVKVDFIMPVNKTALQSLVTTAAAVTDTGYTQQSWEAFQSRLSAAQAMLTKNNATQSEVDAATAALQSAMDGLEIYIPPLPETDYLRNLIRQADARLQDSEEYTEESVYALHAANQAAKGLLAQEYYTQAQVSEAHGNLLRAMNDLKAKEKPPDTPEPPPEGHRYLIDGVLPQDLLPAQVAIMENFEWGRNAGIWLFIVVFIPYIGVRVIRTMFGAQGEARYIDMNSPGANSAYLIDERISGKVRKQRPGEDWGMFSGKKRRVDKDD